LAIVLWFTGLSGAGKTTVSVRARERLERAGFRVAVLDGDDVRARLHRHLGFSRADILENNRLVAELCAEALPDNDVIFVPIISPLEAGRAAARRRLGAAFRLVYFNAPLDFVASADVKGLYRRARDGEIDNLIGVAESNPYEPPADVDLEIDISRDDETASTEKLAAYAIGQLNDRNV
jgi:adenylyl-sulfate kinase